MVAEWNGPFGICEWTDVGKLVAGNVLRDGGTYLVKAQLPGNQGGHDVRCQESHHQGTKKRDDRDAGDS